MVIEKGAHFPINTVENCVCEFMLIFGFVCRSSTQKDTRMTDRKAVIKNADMSEEMQQDAVDCATQAIEKYNIEKVGIVELHLNVPELGFNRTDNVCVSCNR